jgi:alcohol dehydrogenase (NADP+)
VAGSMIGGVKETQEMLYFCAERKIASDIELIPVSSINTAYERMLKNDVKYRFVIDISTM